MNALTGRQREVLDYISLFLGENSYPPTVREIGEHFHISLRAVQDHISALRKKGYLSIGQKRSRSIRVLKDGRAVCPPYVAQVPVVQGVPVAEPLFSRGNVKGYINCMEPVVRRGPDYFALHVQGSTMSGAGIFDNDLAVFECAEAAEHGQIVMAVVGEAATLRRYCDDGAGVCLRAEGPDVQPLYCESPRIVGRLSAIVRTY